jgi:hypothetical protein
VGGEHSSGPRRLRGDPPGGERAGARLSEHQPNEHQPNEHQLSEHQLSEHQLNEQLFREHWWAAVAAVMRLAGDLDLAEDAVQDACCVALERWPAEGRPAAGLVILDTIGRDP